MFTKTQIVLSAAIALGTASTAPAMTKLPTDGQAGPMVQGPTSAYRSDRVAAAPGQITRMTAEYFVPNPAPFKAYTYCASVQLGPSTSKRVLHGEFRANPGRLASISLPSFRGAPKARARNP